MNWSGYISNQTVYMDTITWITWNFHIFQIFFWLFSTVYDIKSLLKVWAIPKRWWGRFVPWNIVSWFASVFCVINLGLYPGCVTYAVRLWLLLKSFGPCHCVLTGLAKYGSQVLICFFWTEVPASFRLPESLLSSLHAPYPYTHHWKLVWPSRPSPTMGDDLYSSSCYALGLQLTGELGMSDVHSQM